MTLLVLFGPPAVGKMTVAQHIAQRTAMRVFHNHMTVDLAVQFFDYGTPGYTKLVYALRHDVIQTCAQHGGPDLIFTYVFALDAESDQVVIETLVDLVHDVGGRVCFAELEASLEARVERNRTPHRRVYKPVMDLDAVERFMCDVHDKHVLNTGPQSAYVFPGEHMKINNEHLNPEEVAAAICAHFALAAPRDQEPV